MYGYVAYNQLLVYFYLLDMIIFGMCKSGLESVITSLTLDYSFLDVLLEKNLSKLKMGGKKIKEQLRTFQNFQTQGRKEQRMDRE